MSRFSLQTANRVFKGCEGVWGELCYSREQTRLVTRIDHDVSTFDEMVQPRSVVHRIHSAPAMQKNDHRRRAWFWRIRFEDPILLSTLSVAIFCNTRMHVLL